MRLILLLIVFGPLLSCLKKIDGADQLNTNIYDKEYTGGCWFVIEDCYTYYNDFGIQKVMVKAVLPESNAPGLKPYLIHFTCQVNNQPEVVFNATVNEDGNYPFYYIATPESSNEYCLEAGIYLVEDDTTINTFTLCAQP